VLMPSNLTGFGVQFSMLFSHRGILSNGRKCDPEVINFI
jgi:hypothetical protein